MVDWDFPRLTVSAIFRNNIEREGRPSFDGITRSKRCSYKNFTGLTDKSMFNCDHVPVTMVRRARIKVMFRCFCYNLFTLMNLKKCGKIVAVV